MYQRYLEWYKASYWHRVFKSVTDRGLVKTVRLVKDEHLPAVRYGVKIAGLVHLDTLEIDSEYKLHGYRYEAVNASAFKAALAGLDISFADASFIDLGCGKGFALMLASRYGFRKLIGVEFSPVLVATCRRNLAAFYSAAGLEHRPAYEILEIDVTKFRLPPGASVLFLCNPFNEVTLKATIRNLLNFRPDNYGRLYVVYVNALHEKVFSDLGFSLINYLPTDPLNVYKNGTAIFRLP
jgi:SAM-dependent methyltransferase